MGSHTVSSPRLWLVVIGLALIPVSAPEPAAAQYYNPSTYNNTRSAMNYRAASRASARAALRRYCRAHPRAQRCRARHR